MVKKTRTILFFLIFFLFLVSASSIIFYSQGYRFNFETKKFFRTGAFSFNVRPRGASVYIDNKLAKKTDLFGTVYIGNLLPKEYEIEIKKSGYLPWKKKLAVEEERVTENKNIYLVPENPQFNLLIKDTDEFFLAPDGKKAVIKKAQADGWTLGLLNLNNNAFSPLFEEKDLSDKKEGVDLISLEWSKDSENILLKIGPKEIKYFVIKTAGNPLLYAINITDDSIRKITFLPRDSQKIFFSQKLKEGNSLFSLNYKNNQISGPIEKDILVFEVFNNDLFWLGKEGYIYQSDLSGNIIRQLNKESTEIDPNSDYQLFIFSEDKIFLKKSDNLYFFNQEKQSLEKIFDKVKKVEISLDSRKTAYFTDNEIWVSFLEEIKEQPNRAKNDRIFLSRFSDKIGDVFWWTNHYLIFSVGDDIKISEIDNRGKINVYNFSEFKNPEIFWNNYDKKLYILSEGGLYSSDGLY